MIQGAIKGMLESLGDQYSVYQEPDLAAQTQDHMQGKLGGIGTYLRIDNGKAFIYKPVKNAPAVQAGLRQDDQIVSIDDQPIEPLIAGLDVNAAAVKVAAKLRGESGTFILSREIFPNVLGPTVVEMTVRFGYAIFTVATLSFLGVGLQPPSPDWGLTVSEEYNNMISGIWWPTLFPALAIASTVIAVNLIADSLQSVLSE